eukprot:502641-Prymnesium_polylepis.1
MAEAEARAQAEAAPPLAGGGAAAYGGAARVYAEQEGARECGPPRSAAAAWCGSVRARATVAGRRRRTVAVESRERA